MGGTSRGTRYSRTRMPEATPPWMWLVREIFPFLRGIILALLLGSAVLVQTFKGHPLPLDQVLRLMPAVVPDYHASADPAMATR